MYWADSIGLPSSFYLMFNNYKDSAFSYIVRNIVLLLVEVLIICFYLISSFIDFFC